jgi:asparagine synthase (glutamine-hydrolysing)
MAWGLEARVPFLDKKFLEVAMNIDAKYKEFNKGSSQETDAEGRPKMEKVSQTSMASIINREIC